MSMWRLVKAEWFINLTCDAPSRMVCIIILRVMVQLMETTLALEGQVLIGSYHPCEAKHEASVTSDFYDGFIDYDGNGNTGS